MMYPSSPATQSTYASMEAYRRAAAGGRRPAAGCPTGGPGPTSMKRGVEVSCGNRGARGGDVAFYVVK